MLIHIDMKIRSMRISRDLFNNNDRILVILDYSDLQCWLETTRTKEFGVFYRGIHKDRFGLSA